MATHFSANQYEDAFSPKHLQNYQVPAQHKQRPSARQGTTKIIANDRGHLNSDIRRDPSSPWGSFVDTWQAEIKPPLLMTKTKLVNPRAVIKSPPRTTVAKAVKPVSAQEEKKLSTPAGSKTEEAAMDNISRSGSAVKSISPTKSTKPSFPAASKVEEATITSNRGGPPTRPASPTPKSIPNTPASDRNSDIPTDQQQVGSPAKPSTPQQAVVTTNNTAVNTAQTDNRPSSKTAVTPDASTKPVGTPSVPSPPKDAMVTTPQ